MPSRFRWDEADADGGHQGVAVAGADRLFRYLLFSAGTLGEATGFPVVLISGLGAQLIAWDDAFCEELVDRGLFVIRFDNRDVGLSSHLADRAASDPSAETAGAAPAASYTLAQMAADTAGLIDNLGLGSAHVVGISLGGMIAQILAIEHPERVRSLTSIMSTTGTTRWAGRPTRRSPFSCYPR